MGTCARIPGSDLGYIYLYLTLPCHLATPATTKEKAWGKLLVWDSHMVSWVPFPRYYSGLHESSGIAASTLAEVYRFKLWFHVADLNWRQAQLFICMYVDLSWELLQAALIAGPVS